MTLTVGSLFSGIGGFDLGLERAGMKVIWQSEIDSYASAVLKKHWPDIPNHGDIRTIRAGTVERPDVLCGGFPCQDISNAGKRAGINGERSGLWSEYARVIGELRPDYVLVENVAALLGRGLERVLGDLAALGFDAEWHCIPASAVGAPHRRDRVWIVAYARRTEWRPLVAGRNVLDRDRSKREETAGWLAQCGKALADADEPRLEGRLGKFLRQRARQRTAWQDGPHSANDAAYSDGIGWSDAARQWWIEPAVGRVAHGISRRVDRLRCLGNAIVPQVAEIIGRAIVLTPK